MIVDTSALVAIALDEPESDDLLALLAGAAIRRISAATLLETWMVMDGRRIPRGSELLEAMLISFDVQVEPVTLAQVEIARTAFNLYGKGSGHGARLNFGDCFAYALARHLDEPLLFLGDDFSRTDIAPAFHIDIDGESEPGE